MRTAFGIDYSVWQGFIPPFKHEEFRDAGCKIEVVGAWHGNQKNQYAAANLNNAYQAGMRVGTYIVINDGRPAREHVLLGKEACGFMWDKLSFVSIDVEMHTSVSEILLAAQYIMDLEGRPNIYTAKWVFEQGLVQGDHSLLTALPLWYAHYDRTPQLTPTPGLPWTRAIGHQYMGTTPFCGVGVDYNHFDLDYVEGGEDEVLTPKELELLQKTAWWSAAATRLAADTAKQNADVGVLQAAAGYRRAGERIPYSLIDEIKKMPRIS